MSSIRLISSTVGDVIMVQFTILQLRNSVTTELHSNIKYKNIDCHHYYNYTHLILEPKQVELVFHSIS